MDWRDARALYHHLKTMKRKQPGGPTCLQEMGFTSLGDFKIYFARTVRRAKVI